MTALSDLLERPVRDPDGAEVARLHDLVVRISAPAATDDVEGTESGRAANGAGNAQRTGGDAGDAATRVAGTTDARGEDMADVYPPVIGIVARLTARQGSRDVFVPWDGVRHLGSDGAALATSTIDLQPFARRDHELLLGEGLLDRQVVDVEGRRVVRVNDVEVAEREGVWRLIAVDISVAALVHRLPGGLLARRMAGMLGRQAESRAPLIDWAQIIPVADDGATEGGALRLRVARDRLDVLHPADLARVLEQLSPQRGAEFLEQFDDARAADTLEEMEDERQAQVLRAMDPERAADVLEEMEPDEAADALQSFLSREEAEDLIERMDPEEALEVEELLHYAENSAGGMMTTEYVAVPIWATAGGVITSLRAHARAAEREEVDPLPAALPEIYIVAREGEDAFEPRPASAPVPLQAEGRLVGVLELRDLLLAYPEARLFDIMRSDPPVVHPDDDAVDAARMIAEEDLVALPVVDEAEHLLGIVTVDDAIDVILPAAWKKRLPRRYK